MSLDTVATILAKRVTKLQTITGSTSSHVSLNHGQPSTGVSSLVQPVPKKVFTILAWNIQDYKDSKIYNPFVNAFVWLLAERLEVDLLMLIETDFDLTEAVANVEGESGVAFGDRALNPVTGGPSDDWAELGTDAERIKRLEEMAEGLPTFWPFGSAVAHRRVPLPDTFRFSDFQTGKFKPTSSEWGEMVEEVTGLAPAYVFTDTRGVSPPITDYDGLVTAAKGDPRGFWNTVARHVVFTRIPCGTCLGQQPAQAACVACAATGVHSPDPDEEQRVLETLREIVGRSVLPGIDTETYTLLWRHRHDRQAPSRTIITAVPATGGKGAWVDPGGCRLTSTDTSGKELGYQDPSSKFNGRSPYVVPLRMQFDGAVHDVPLVLFHSIWGDTRDRAVLQGRVDSVSRAVELAVNFVDDQSVRTVQVKDCEDFVILGDLNLDYKPESKRGYTVKAYSQIGTSVSTLPDDEVVPVIGGTQSVFTTVSTALKNQLARAYTNAYDQFLMRKGGTLFRNVVNACVVDVLTLALDEVNANTALKQHLADELTRDHNQTSPSDDLIAFYLYRQYVSDHLPILLDVLVDDVGGDAPSSEPDVTLPGAIWVSRPPRAFLEQHNGAWTALAASTATVDEIHVEHLVAQLRGRVVGLVHPDVVIVAVGDPAVWFRGTLPTHAAASFALGERVEGEFVLGTAPAPPQEEVYRFAGRWSECAGVTDGKYALSLSDDKRSFITTARVKALILPDHVLIKIAAVKGEEPVKARLFEGAFAGLAAGEHGLVVGGWARGTLMLS